MTKFLHIVGTKKIILGGRGIETGMGHMPNYDLSEARGYEIIPIDTHILIREGNEVPVTVPSRVRCSQDRAYIQPGKQAYYIPRIRKFMCIDHYKLLLTYERVKEKYNRKFYQVTITELEKK
jgi:hypothetical protein